MAEKNKSGFHTVGDTDMEEYNRKIKEHRRKILRRTVIVTAVILLVLTGLGLYMALRHYENYDIMSTAERSDTDATHFTEFQGNILKYSNDGAFYLDAANELIWNQTYEMSSPKLDTCGNYLSIYDKGGTKIYILTPTKLVGSIETTMQIQQVCVAEQGTVAVLMKKDKAAYLALYDREGNSLAEGEIHGQNGGYPIAIALSNDAVKLAVSMININEGSVKSTIAFYNYGTVGQNEIDHCVGVNNYDDMVIPEMEFTSNDRMVAFGDTKAVIFEGVQKPQAIAEIPMDEKTKSIFYNEHYIGIVTGNEDEAVTNHLAVYDENGKLVMEKDFGLDYSSIEFLTNNEICIRNAKVCDIYTVHGVYKFHHEFEEELFEIIPGKLKLNYTLVLKDTTQRIRLK